MPAGGNSYKGLTIRIGADASSLEKTLASVRSSASSAQKELSRIRTALKWDPTSLKLTEQGLTSLETKSVSVAAKIKRMASEIKNMNNMTSRSDPSRTLGQMSANIDDAVMHAEKLKAQFNDVNTTIRTLRQELAVLGGASPEQAKQWNSVQLKDYIEKIKQGTSETKVADNVLKSYLAKIKDLGRESSRLNLKLMDAEDIARIRDANVEIERERANLKKTAAEYREMGAAARLNAQGINQINSQLATTDNIIGKATAKFRTLDTAMKGDPTNASAVVSRAKAAADVIDMYKSKVAELTNKYKQLSKTTGASISFRGIQEFNKDLEKSKANMDEAKVAYDMAKGQLSSYKYEMDEAAQAMLRLSAAGKGMGTEMDEARSRFLNAKSGVSSLKAEVAELSAKFNAAEKAYQGEQTEAELRDVRSEINKTKAEMENFKTSAFNASQSAGNGFYMLRSVGTTLYSTLTPIVTMGASYMIQAADDIDGAYRDMRKTVDGTEEQFESLKQQAIDFSRTHVTSPDQILEVQAIGGQLGVAADDLGDFSEVVSNLDVATDLDAETAADDLGKLSTVVKDVKGNYDNFGDALVRLGNNFPGHESDIMDITTRFAGMASTVGMSATDMLAWSTAATATGQKSEAAGSAMQRFIGYIETAMSKGGDSVKQFSDVAGVSAEQFAKDWETNPTTAMREFIVGLGKMKEAGGSVDSTLVNMGITGVRDRQLIEGLANSYDSTTGKLTVLDDALSQSASAWSNGGDAAEEARKKAEGFSGQLSIMQNNAKIFGSELGESFAPALGVLNTALQGLTTGYEHLTPAMKGFIDVLIVGGAAAGPMMMGIGALGQGMTAMKKHAAESTLEFAKMQTAERLSAAGIDEVAQEAIMGGASFSKLDKNVQKSVMSMQKASRISKLTAISVNALKGGVAVAGVAFATALAIGIKEAYDNMVEMQNATTGFDNSLLESTASVGNMTTAMKDLRPTYDEVNKSLKESQTAHANMAEKFTKTWETVKSNNGALDAYVSTIDNLANKTNLSASQQEQLKAAVQGYNDITGSSIEVIDAQNGMLSQNTDEIDKNAEAWKRQAIAKAYAEEAGDIARQQAKDTMILSDAQKAATRAQDEYNQTLDEYDGDTYAQEVMEAKARLDAANNSLSRAKDVVNQDNAALAKTSAFSKAASSGLSEFISKAENIEGTGDKFKNAAQDADGFSAMLASLGVTTKNFGSISKDSLEGAADAFTQLNDAGIDVYQVAEACSQAGIGIDEFASIGAEGFKRLYNASGQDIGKMTDKLKTLSELKIDPKKVTVDEDGTIEVAGQKLLDLDAQWIKDKHFTVNDDGTITTRSGAVLDLNNMTINGKHFTVNDDGTITTEQGAVIDLNSLSIDTKHLFVTDDGTIVDEDGKVWDLDRQTIDGKHFEVDDDGTIRTEEGKVGRIQDLTINNKDFSVIAHTEDANSALGGILNKIAGFAGKTFDFWVNGHGSSADGGIKLGGGILRNSFQSPELWRKIRSGFNSKYAHAEGAIVNTPTFSSDGHVYGEAGAEAIIPLTNPRYVKPFARTVAEQMGEIRGGSQAPTVTTINQRFETKVVRSNDDMYTAAAILNRNALNEARKVM
jgi:TP901 family phage tail tape measure protein